MANTTITGLQAAAALSGSEVLPVDQNGSTVKTTVQDIANLAGGGSSTFDVVTVGTLGTSPISVSFSSIATLTPAEGTQNAPIVDAANFSLNGGMGFTGTLSSISFPTLVAGSIGFSGIPTLTTVDLPLLETAIYQMMGALTFSNNSSLTTVNIPSLISIPNNSYLNWTGNAFSQQTVDNILVRMVATNATNGYLDLSQGTSAAPSQTGLDAKSVLQGRGWSIQTN